MNEIPQADLSAVVDLARRAPSVHNTQPWQFGTADGVLTLSRDEHRRLAVLDPDARQATISCGAALHLARLGLRAQGLTPCVHVVRADARAVEVRVTAGAGAVPTDAELALSQAARERHMQRGPFGDAEVTADELTRMRLAVQGEGGWVRFLETTAEQVPLVVLLATADAEERDDPALQEELAWWSDRPGTARDGLPPEAANLGEGPRATHLMLRQFGVAADTQAATGEPPAAEHPLVAVIGTENDTPADWLAAGQALSALLLVATVDGIQASPLGQVLDRPWSRRRLAAELGVVGHPQMVLRLGHADPGPETPRRPVEDLFA